MRMRLVATLAIGLGIAFGQPSHRVEPRQQGGRAGGPGPGGPPGPAPGGGGSGRGPLPDAASGGRAPGGKGSNQSFREQVGAVRRQLHQEAVFGPDRQMLLGLATAYLDRSEQADRNKKQRFVADRLLASASALQQAIAYSQRLSDAKLAPRREQVSARLETIYFRTQQADYFFETSGEAAAKPVPELARRWYQKALQFLDSDPGTSENYANAAGQLVSALEYMAQASVASRSSRKAR